MIPFFKDLLFNFFLHIQINTLNLPYQDRLPRPRRSHPVSKLFRRLFEVKAIKSFFGVNLAMAMLAIPLLTQNNPVSNLEPELNIPETSFISSDETIALTTKPREVILPVEHLRFVGQYYHPGHPAYDLNGYVGDDIYAFSAGRVHYLEEGLFGYGKYIILDHGHGLMSVYAHLKQFDVVLGQGVDAGQKIGEMGMTGYTTGPHLHFEIRDNSVAINPGTYLDL